MSKNHVPLTSCLEEFHHFRRCLDEMKIYFYS